MEKTVYLMYLRKSTDSEDRQIQSIEDQKKELERIARQFKLEIKGIYQENMSAKKPGRPEFNRMLADIRKGKANGILCWKLNRLARNPIDGGEIMWLVQEGIVRSIQTPGREYKTGDNVIIMSVELGMASQYVLDLSRDVKRGMLSKAEKGWRPGRAPIGYRNDKGGEQGSKVIHTDDEKFPIVRKMWDLMLTGEYSVSKILDIANNEWGLRRTTRKGEEKLYESHGYVIFTNPFYFGEYEWNGKPYQGKHRPMVTREEFEYVQKLLGIKSKPQSRHKDLPYRGTIRCGECGCHITTEIKTKRIKSKGVLKSFIYHHCTKKKPEARCQQKPIVHEKLNEQIMAKLDSITLPESFLGFALNILNRDNELETDNRNIVIGNMQKALKDCQEKIDNLLKVYISSGNSEKELISDEEFKTQKTALLREKTEIEQKLDNLSRRADEWLELTEKTFKFAVYAKHNFDKGDYKTKTSILRALGSSFVLKDGKIEITLRKQYQIIEKGIEMTKAQNPRLELTSFASDKTKTASFEAVSATWSG
ncbi:MAG: recombinase family protein [Candidatus Moranbacteria bacterium]|nr:recombinase family protein [Candidatus Moranbacteria bacterium]